MNLDAKTVTRLLEAWSEGEPEALARLIPHVLDDLRRMAGGLLAREPAGITLQPTALVNELYLRVAGKCSVQWENSAHFFGAMSEVIRHIIVDHARKRRAVKRGGGLPSVSLDHYNDLTAGREEDLMALDDALTGLAKFDPRLSAVVHLRFFGGLSSEEIGVILKISAKTVKRDWQKAKIWLYKEIKASERP